MFDPVGTETRAQILSFPMSDGYPVHCRCWAPRVARGAVVLLHGIISHSGWYMETGNRLAKAGFRVYAVDRRGSGLNSQDRGDVTTANRWIDDVLEVVEAIQGNTPASQPRPVLAGISWGGVLAAAVAERFSDRLSGVAFICPGFHSRKGTSNLQHRLVSLATRLGLGGIEAAVPLRDPKLFTKQPLWQSYIRDDPFTLRKVTLRLATASAELYRQAVIANGSINIPVALMLAEDDAIIHNSQVLQHCQRIAAGPLDVYTYPQAAHTLEFDAARLQYLQDLVSWIQKTCQAKKPIL